MSAASTTPQLPDIVREHAEDAAFDWLLRDVAVADPAYDLADLAELDESVEANLDGLLVAGPLGWEMAQEELGNGDASGVFAAGALAIESGNEAGLAEVREVALSDPELVGGLVAALAWLPYEKIQNALSPLLAGSPAERRVALRAVSAHRADPGDALREALNGDDPELRAAGWRAVGELGRADLLALPSHEADADFGCRLWSAWSQALLGRGPNALLEVAQTGSPEAERAAGLALRCLTPGEGRAWLATARAEPACTRAAIVGAGALGDPAEIDWLVECMREERLARLAGLSLELITGVNLDDADLDVSEPTFEEMEAAGQDLDEDFEPDGDDLDERDDPLLWPEPEAVASWWSTHRVHFQPGVRYLGGSPVEATSVSRLLVSGRQPHRAAAALERSLLTPAPLFETRAPGLRQQQWLGLH